jgi:hypothetical protein
VPLFVPTPVYFIIFAVTQFYQLGPETLRLTRSLNLGHMTDVQASLYTKDVPFRTGIHFCNKYFSL